MLSNINKLPRSLFGLIVVLFSLHVESKPINYEFNFLNINVASLSVAYNEASFHNDKINSSDLHFRLSTQGPLKLYRDYSSQGSIIRNKDFGWDYFLQGVDRGQPEDKQIRYFYNKAPIIKKFIDDAGVYPIDVDPLVDKDAIDPFSVLFKTIDQLNHEQKCSNEYSVMDGKRRYKVKVELTERKYDETDIKTDYQDIIFNCKFTLIKLKEEKRRWPFNRRDRSMIVWFSSKMKFKPIRFYFETPIGRIVG